jgi:hypothetical protein
MKKLSQTVVGMILCLLTTNLVPYAQIANKGAVHSRPTKINDYIVLNKSVPDVSYYDIIIQEQVFKETDSIYEYEEVQTTRMQRSFYKKIDAKFKDEQKYFITVLAYNADDEIIIEEGPFPICADCQVGFSCQWGCVAGTYAYGLNLGPVSSGSSMITMSELSPNDGIDLYYYEYVGSSDWSTFQTAPYQYYGLSANNFDPMYAPNVGKIIKLSNVNQSQHIKNATGQLLQGTVFKVRKYLGPWHASNGNMNSGIFSGGQENCGQTFNWAKSMINNYSNNFSSTIPNLSCSGVSFSPTEPEIPSDSGPNKPKVEFDLLDCYKKVLDRLSGNEPLNVVANQLNDCDKKINGSAFSWPEWVSNITIVSMSDSTWTPVELNYDTFFNSDGDYIFQGFTFLPGLYYIGLQSSNTAYINAFFERTDSSFQNLQMADFINYNPYPNPLINNEFSLEVVATCNIEFTYEVKNSIGTTVFTRRYKMDKNETLIDRISLSIPSNYSGLLFNKFIFTDKSMNQFTMVK